MTASPRCARAPFDSRAYIALWVGDFEAAEAHATEALALAEEVGDRGPRRGRAASWVTRWCSRTRAPGERSSRARPSSPGRRATTGRSWRPSR